MWIIVMTFVFGMTIVGIRTRLLLL